MVKKPIHSKRSSLAAFVCAALVVGWTAFAPSATAQMDLKAYDIASNYGGTWANGSNGGYGFGAWDVTASANNYNGFYVGNPGDKGLTGMLNPSFGMYAHTGATWVNANRTFAALNVGDELSFKWAINWDSSTGGNKGFIIFEGTTARVTVTNGASSSIYVNGVNTSFGYGVNAMTWTIKRINSTQITVTANDRDGSGTYAVTNSSGAPTSLRFFMTKQGDSNGNREPFFNELKIQPTVKYNQTITFAEGAWQTKTYGDANFSLSASASSGLAVSFASSDTSVATVSGTTVTILKAGTTTITASQAGNNNYNAAANVQRVLTVNKKDPTVTGWPTATPITLGQTLADSTLVGGSSTPAGSFSWTTPAFEPSTAGTFSYGVTFTPTDTVNYNTAQNNVSLTVNAAAKQDPEIYSWPTATTITYGQTLAASTLSGGSASVLGTFAWSDGAIVPVVGAPPQSVTFYPTDDETYNTANSTVAITVNKANPTVTTWPSASAISYGQTLASSTLSGGSATPAGAFAFTTPATAPDVGTAAQSVTYTPTDTANYNAAQNNVNVTVNKATPTIATAPMASTILVGQSLAASTLSGGAASVAGSFAFTTPATTPARGTANQSVTFMPTDTARYNAVAFNVGVTVWYDRITFAAKVPSWADHNPSVPQVWGPFVSGEGWAGYTMVWDSTCSRWTVPVEVNNAAAQITYQLRFCQATATKYQKATDNFGADATYTTGTGEIWIDASDTATFTWSGNDFYLAANNISQGRAAATVTLGNTTQTYDGTPKSVSVTTIPASMPVTVTYAGGSTPPTAAGSYAVVATAQNCDYQGTASGMLTINKAASTVTATGDTAYTYDGTPQGPASANVTGSSGALSYGYSGTGSTTYGPSSTKPSAAGTYQMVASVAADANYAAASSSPRAFTIAKATPVVTTPPTASGISLGQTLASSLFLTDGTVTPAGGTWAWANSATQPEAQGSAAYPAIYTPAAGDQANYAPAQTDVSVTVGPPKETPVVTWPTASAITYGQSLSSSTFSGGSAVNSQSESVLGTFAWANASLQPNAGTANQTATFTPTDTATYNSEVGSVSVTVNKATPTITTPPTASAIREGQTLASSTLSGGSASVAGTFAFTAPSTAPGAGTADQSVTFTPADTANHNNVVFNVSVTVLPLVEPSVQASGIGFADVTLNSVTVFWTSGDGDTRLVVVRAQATEAVNPADGSSYAANSQFGAGAEIGAGNFVVYSGSGSSVAVTGLAPGVTYVFRVYEFNGSGSLANYNVATASGNPNSVATVRPPIYINEVQSSNGTTLTDNFGESPDWIELYNAGSVAIDLTGWGLSDSAANPFKWTFGNVSLQPGYRLVYASSKNVTEGQYLHTSYNISADGEDIVLTHPSGTRVDIIPAKAIARDLSLGRYPNGTGEEYFFVNPTPGAANQNNGYRTDLTAPAFSVEGGMYNSTVSLELSTDIEGAVIRYTLDGSEPTASSPVYSSALSLGVKNTANDLSEIPTNYENPGAPYYEGWQAPNGTVFKFHTVRARIFKDGAPGPHVTHSYIVSPAGAARYSLPVVSIATAKANLFDDLIGIYTPVNGNMWQSGTEWERPGTVEYFEADGTRAFSGNVGLRLNGNLTRNRPRKALRVYARGPAKFEYPFFPETSQAAFDSFILRNGGNDWGQGVIRDLYAQSLTANTAVDRQYGYPVIVFLNGEYWGIHDLRERLDEGYIENKYGLGEQEYGQVVIDRDYAPDPNIPTYDRGNVAMATDYTNLWNFINANSLASEQNYATVKDWMDVDNFADFFQAHIYTGNTDWPGNNIRAWRSVAQLRDAGAPYRHDGRWRYMIYDIDFGFGENFNYVPGNESYDYVGKAQKHYGINEQLNLLAFATNASSAGSYWSNEPDATRMFRRLLENGEFRQNFITRFSDQLNTAYSRAYATNKWSEWANLLAPEMTEHVSRWRQPSDWTAESSRIRAYAEQRAAAVWTHLQDVFKLGRRYPVTVSANPVHGHVKVNTIDLNSGTAGFTGYPWTGTYFTNYPVALTAVPEPGYSFVEWKAAFGANAMTAADSGANYTAWANGNNLGNGFGAWALTVSGTSGHFVDFGQWGLWANNGGMAEAVRPFSSALQVGQTVGFRLQNRWVQTGGSIGVNLRTAANSSRWYISFTGGQTHYVINGVASSIPYTTAPLDVELTLVTADTYSAKITRGGDDPVVITGNLLSTGSIDRFRTFNNNAGNGSNYDFFVNDLRIFTRTAPGTATTYSTEESISVNLSAAANFEAVFEEIVIPETALVHYWNFNDAVNLLAPSYSLVAGAGISIVPGPTTAYLAGTGQDFAAENAQFGDEALSHLRVNNPIGAVMDVALPTTGFEDIVVKYETRRSGSGAGTQIVSYTLDGATYVPWTTVTTFDAPPAVITFDFSAIAGADNNPAFGLRIEFEQGGGSTTGNNRFDNWTVEGVALPGQNQSPEVVAPIAYQSFVAGAAAAQFALGSVFSDPDNDPLTFEAVSSDANAVFVGVVGSTLTVTPVRRGGATVTVTANDGENLPVATTFYVLVHPEAHVLAQGAYAFGEWVAAEPVGSYPGNMLFLQSDRNDSVVDTPLLYAYHNPDAGAAPYNYTSGTRMNGLGTDGVAFLNTGRNRDLGGALLALDTRNVSVAPVSWLAGTVLPNLRIYAIRLQYRVGASGDFVDVLDENEQPVEYVRNATAGHSQPMGPVNLPAAALGQEYVQVLWRYYWANPDPASGARAQLRLDDIEVANSLPQNFPPTVEAPIDNQSFIEGTAAANFNLNNVFSDPENASLSFGASSSASAIVSVGVVGSTLTVTPVARGGATITVTATDGVNDPVSTSFYVLVYPAAHDLAAAPFSFGAWNPDLPENTYPTSMLFLQSTQNDPVVDTPLTRAYWIAPNDYHANDAGTIGYPYNNTGRSRINGLNDDGIAFINTGAGRDLGGALLALDTRDVTVAPVSWLGGTVLPNTRVYAIRLQYRVGTSGPFVDVLDGNNQPVVYMRDATAGHTQALGPVDLPADALDEPYVQVLWRYYWTEPAGATGARAQLRLDEILVDNAPPAENQPPQVSVPVAFQELIKGKPASFNLNTVFLDPDNDPLTFSASSSDETIVTVQVTGATLSVNPLKRGDATVTVSASDGEADPVSTSFRVLVYPEAHVLATGAFAFGEWAATEPSGSYPANMMFLQSNINDPVIDTALTYPYSIPLADASVPADASFPYAATARTRINGLGADGIAFINTGRGRDLGGALLALDTRNVADAPVSWLGGTVLPNLRINAIRLQYRVGATGPFLDVLDQNNQPVEYVRNATTGHSQPLGPVLLPAAAMGQEYVQVLWRYYLVSGTSGARAQLRLDDIMVANSAALPAVALEFATQPPAYALSGSALAPFSVRAVDGEGVTDVNFSGTISLALASGSGTLGGVSAVSAVEGVATFSAATITGSGAHTLVATSGSLAADVSTSILVDADPIFLPGGTAAWNSDANWTSLAYPNAAGASAKILAPASAARNVDVNAPITVGALTIDNGSSTVRNRVRGQVAGNSLTFDAASGNAALTVNGNGVGYVEFEVVGGVVLADDLRMTVNNVVGDPEYGALRLRQGWTGPGGLIKAGAGLASLTGEGKGFEGPIVVEQGVLAVSQPSSPASSSGTSVESGGQMRLTSANDEFGARIYGFGGTLSLAGLGRSGVDAGENLGVLGALRYEPGTPGNRAVVAGPVAIAADTDIHVATEGNELELAGALSGSDDFDKTGAGTLILSGASSTFTGSITVDTGGLLVEADVPASSILVKSATFVGGLGSIAGDLHFNGGARLVFNPAGPLEVGGTATFDGFTIYHLIGLDADTPLGTYTLIDGDVDTANVSQVGIANAVSIGNGKFAYFREGSLELRVYSVVTVSDASADNKPYDGTPAATISGGSLVGVADGDVVAIDSRAGTFAQADAGNGIAVTAALTLAGQDAGKYELSQPNGLMADIAPLAITIIPDADKSKVYGEEDPVFTFTADPALLGTDAFSGALGRTPGENAGLYDYALGNLSAGGNYELALAAEPAQFAIAKATATVELFQLVGNVYDGTAKEAQATTVPEGLAVEFTYDGSSTAPIAAGQYAVTGTVNDVNYAGMATGTLIIVPADQTIDFPAIGDQYTSDVVQLAATASSGLSVGFELVAGPAQLDGATLTFTGPGEVTVRASQAGDANWNPATAVERTFNVSVRLAVEVNVAAVNVREAGEGRFYVRLNQAPEAEVAVGVVRGAGSASLVVAAGSTRRFTPENWAVWQSVTLAQASDANTVNETASFLVSADGADGQTVEATALDVDGLGDNLALASAGATMPGHRYNGAALDGIFTYPTNYAYTVWTNEPPASMTLDLAFTSTVTRVRLLNWDWDARVHRYLIEASVDNQNWFVLADASAEDRRGWDDWDVANQTVRYLRFTGLSSSFSSWVRIAEWEVYGSRLAAPAPAPMVSRDAVNVRENGEGRFYVKLAAVPPETTEVTVAPVADGDADLSVKSGGTLTFTPLNWDVWQVVTLQAAADGDSLAGTATFRVTVPGATPVDVAATELDADIGPNLALDATGSKITGGSYGVRANDGNHLDIGSYGWTVWTNDPPGAMVLDLKISMNVAKIRLLHWDWDVRTHNYLIEASANGTTWSTVVDAGTGVHQGWEEIVLGSPVEARYLRFTGLSNSFNGHVRIAEWEVYGQPTVSVAPVVDRGAVNVRENGEGRFYVKLNTAPLANLAVTVAPVVGGDADLSVKSGGTLTFTPTNWDVWQMVTLQAAADGDALAGTATFRVTAPGAGPTDVAAAELDENVGDNVALAATGSKITGGSYGVRANDGNHLDIGSYGWTVWTNVPAGAMVLDLKLSKNVERIRLLHWDWDVRTHTYLIEASADGAAWTPIVDAGAGVHQGWEEIVLGAPVAARYLRFTGLSNSFNAHVRIAEWEVYCVPTPASAPVVNRGAVNVRENGEGRFYVKLATVPPATTEVTVAPVAGGDADLSVKSGGSLTFTPANWNAWQMVTLQAAADGDALAGTATFRVTAPGAMPVDVVAAELDADIGPNLALAATGSKITGGSYGARANDGNHLDIGSYGWTVWTNVPPGDMVLDLKLSKNVTRIRLLHWDWDVRTHNYQIEASVNGTAWTTVVDAGAGVHQGWEEIVLGTPVSARYLRFTGLSNSYNSHVRIAEWEVYGQPTVALAPLVNRSAVGVRENGEGRFYVKLNTAPLVDTAVTVAPVAGGDADLSVKSGGALTFTPANWNAWQMVTLQAADDGDALAGTATFRVTAAGAASVDVAASEFDDDIGPNVALAATGSKITGGSYGVRANDGNHLDIGSYGWTVWTNVPPGAMVLDLKLLKNVARIRLLHWDWDVRTHNYLIEASVNGTTWTTVVDAGTGVHQGWEDVVLESPVAARYLRFTGLSNSYNAHVRIAEWEVFEATQGLRRLAQGKDVAQEESEPISVLTCAGPEDLSGWNAVDGDSATAWVGQKPGGGYLVVEYQPALELSALDVELADDSLAGLEVLTSEDGVDWTPFLEDAADRPIRVNFLWLVFPDDGTGAVPKVLEILPNP